nr:class I SAM-dependent methyltransferase [Gilvimarinus xylanilyticus]
MQSWGTNATAWTDAVRNKTIASRAEVTNRAIIDAVLALKPQSVLDIGCGEGWLVRALAGHASRLVGVDATEALIDQARQSGDGEFYTARYEDISQCLSDQRFDVAVCNFSLLGKESVEVLLAAIPRILNDGGHLVIQTLHPRNACGDTPYRDGWREGSWKGFSRDFCDAPPWYFRTLESWIALLTRSDLALYHLLEPFFPDTQQPASLILVAEPTDRR